jgi:hypothetical protein
MTDYESSLDGIFPKVTGMMEIKEFRISANVDGDIIGAIIRWSGNVRFGEASGRSDGWVFTHLAIKNISPQRISRHRSGSQRVVAVISDSSCSRWLLRGNSQGGEGCGGHSTAASRDGGQQGGGRAEERLELGGQRENCGSRKKGITSTLTERLRGGKLINCKLLFI